MDARTPAESAGKRPRSPTGDFPPIASKIPKTHSNHLQINYLARQYPDNLPLVSADDNMSAIIHLIGEYDGVLHRHESIAGNLGACPLGPILIKRFERLFDGPPRVLKSHGKDPANITWLDVVEFAKSKPEQFNLEKSRNGVRVCQFYTKQCRVEISEEDFVLIASGMPQKMIPPQPIIEDEEKELGALEILEKNIQQIIQVADQVSARARQLNHRLKNRRTAIVTRRENDLSLHSQQQQQHGSSSPPWRELNGNGPVPIQSNASSATHSPSTGFVAVNSGRPAADVTLDDPSLSSHFMFSHSNTDNVTIINGTSIKGASPTTRAELMKKFFTTQDRQSRALEEAPSTERQPSRPRARASDAADHPMYTPGAATVAIPHTPSSLLPPPKSHHHEKDDGGPFKMEMVARMEELQRGERIMPPCDRCRRLHMDCLKNLTACMGCTKKHAKCSWKDVKEDELHEYRAAGNSIREPRTADESSGKDSPSTTAAPAPSTQGTPSTATAAIPYPPGTPHRLDTSPRRAMSEMHSAPRSVYERRPSLHQRNDPDDDDPDANQRLMQAILDTVDHHARAAAVHEVTHEREQERDRERNLVRA
ncbi:hypothetical protein P168DRAFT_308532 [Aspergillus campestris IBT 28561]|uniref:C6 finger domain protein n=1 Tax=Aspergillus campestris (strain IBT 28561) TaxID=1392248 RepID=A0A2I1DFF6_ASPC2|nr:uncharacterized protein P168DRAFT_308532 [Aspergillus campestris IBT 28561]PKY08590.1 hypothetical protein P168DRAFT_308532 [Aspergillus campestris IBT 28561]